MRNDIRQRLDLCMEMVRLRGASPADKAEGTDRLILITTVPRHHMTSRQIDPESPHQKLTADRSGSQLQADRRGSDIGTAQHRRTTKEYGR
jgi:hypothetical protein